jgi:transposase-like protein
VFKGRHFQDEIIVLCVPWYLLFSLSYRDLEELMAEPLPRAAAVFSQSAARTDPLSVLRAE